MREEKFRADEIVLHTFLDAFRYFCFEFLYFCDVRLSVFVEMA